MVCGEYSNVAIAIYIKERHCKLHYRIEQLYRAEIIARNYTPCAHPIYQSCFKDVQVAEVEVEIRSLINVNFLTDQRTGILN